MIVQDYLAYLANFAIKKTFQKQGFGSYFLSFAILEAKKLHCSILYLDVRVSNKNAIKLYQKVGFSPLKRIENFYKKPQEDSLQMGLKIG
jgi:ribosomal protein S18 acetylase RimI-like enzyme